MLHDEGERTRVNVDTELTVTGRPAQFGRGVMVDVSNKLLGTFADCLERTLAADQPPAGAEPVVPVEAVAREPVTAPSSPEAIDLLETAGGPVLKRVLPAAAAIALLVLVWRLIRRIGS